MWITNDINNLRLESGTAITIGAFDGVHRGHQALIARLVEEARARGLTSVALTFNPLPVQVLERRAFGLLTTLTERLERIAALGVEGVVIVPFTRELMDTPASAFVDQLLAHLRLRVLYVGPDFKLGRNQEGNIDFLTRLSVKLGYEVHVLEDTVLWKGKPVRSSHIRQALRAGAIEEANGCLGYAYSLSGVIGSGDQRGRKLGFPTANLILTEDRLLPGNGIYVCRAHLKNGVYQALTNVGTRPTFNHSETTVEAYLLDFSADIYGELLTLDFLAYLRPEARFDSAEKLVAQMRRDEIDARAWFAAHPAPCQSLSTGSS